MNKIHVDLSYQCLLFLIIIQVKKNFNFIRSFFIKFNLFFIIKGTGDLFGALLLAYYLKHPTDLKLVCEKAVAATRSVILNTAKYQKENNIVHPELRIIQSRDALENPEIEFVAETL